MLKKTSIIPVIVFSIFLGYATWADAAKEAKKDAPENEADTYEMLNLFGEVLERAKMSYVEDVSDKKLIEAAINGMLVALDPHSSYLDDQSFKYMNEQTKGKFGGLGIEVTMEQGLVMVVSPIDDTPAYEAGIKTGDFITHIDGEQVIGMSLNDAVDKMRGKVGTKVKLTIRRINQKPFDVKLTREEIKIRSVKSELKSGDVAYIRISSFTEDTDQAVGVKRVGILGCVIKNLADASVIIQGFIIENHSFNLPEAALVGKNETCKINFTYSHYQTHSGVFEDCYLIVGDLLGHVYHFPCDIKCEGADNVSVSYRIANVTCVGVEFERGER